MKLLTKITLIIATGAILAISLITFFVFVSTKSALQSVIQSRQQEITRQTMDRIDQLLFNYYVGIQNIAEEESIARTLGGELADIRVIERRIKELPFLTGPWDLLQIVKSNRKVLVSNIQQGAKEDVFEENTDTVIALNEALSGHTYYSDFFISKDTGRPTMVFSSPIRDQEKPNNPIVGAVLGQMAWPIITELIQNLNPESNFKLYTRDGLLIAGNQGMIKDLSNKNERVISSIDKFFTANPSGGVTKEFEDGPEALITVAPSFGYLGYKGNQWILLAETPTVIAFAPATNTARNTALILLPIILFVAIVVQFLLNQFVVKPIIKLTKFTSVIAVGNFSEQLSVTSNDEIGKLAESFNKMAGELGTLYAGLEDKISERTKEIQDEKNKLEVTLESIGDGAFSINADGLIVFFNKVAEKISGYASEEIIGKHYKSVLHFILEKDGSENYQFIENSLENGMISHISNHTVLITKNGEKIPVEDSAAPLKNESGKVVGVIVIFRDVTKAREIEKTKTNFISIASHQLRTPLTALRWITEMFLSGDLGTLTDDQKKFSGDMYKSVRRLLDLINIFLVSSRVEEGRVDIKPVPVDMMALTQEVIDSLGTLIKAKKIATHLGKQPLPKINLELEMFRQVILNLVSNAINYTPDNGAISIEFKLDDGQVICSVRDNGIGIPKKDQYKIFQKFFRADNAISVVADGSGLGLNMVKSIIETWSGKIWFDSEEGRGTTFYFTIPLSGMQSKAGEVKINE